jgi:cyclic pyranopterin phosphate synthase
VAGPEQGDGAPELTQVELTHFRNGLPRMVDVTDKVPTTRSATAEGWVRLPPEARRALEAGSNPKGDPLTVARLAGLAGSKRTADLITLCHPVPVTGADVRVTLEREGVRIEATVRTTAPTGVEMEALTAVTVAALNVYDMLKAASKAVEITDVRLLTKTGGKSGDYQASGATR